MKIVDVGSGPPLVIVPGIQGRWEWMKPAVDALAARCRVITFSLADEPTCAGRFETAHGFNCYVDQVGEAMDQAGVSAACVCGVSYGGLVAAAFAARHPERVCGLVLVSALPPSWKPNRRVRFYLRAPRLLMPLFLISSARMYKEIAAATPGFLNGIMAAARHGLNVLRHMLSPIRMARRVHLLGPLDVGRECAATSPPTLVVTGDPALDNVVPVALTEQYLQIWPHAERVTLERTGHLGLITRPARFADAVVPFVERNAAPADRGPSRRADVPVRDAGGERRVG